MTEISRYVNMHCPDGDSSHCHSLRNRCNVYIFFNDSTLSTRRIVHTLLKSDELALLDTVIIKAVQSKP
ncbi:hypothetical protein MAR_002919 [Mya arenaria]|uniref:Uncharacterized protein n=1 Tax=Mya arenaria TaxID=6604 RepID=A0ABY7GDT5_MYAAR|nr:hypothetical protein MAR_002919 [Mya arenaria]